MRVILALGIVVIVSSEADAQFSQRPASVYGTEAWEFNSKVNGRSYVSFVAVPDDYQKNQNARYPVVYITDSHINFPLIVPIYRLLRVSGDLPDLILVGIAGTDPIAWGARRRLELTPTRNDPPSGGPTNEIRSGGAPAFLEMMSRELIPQIEQRYRTNAERTFVGYSLGGLFGVYALLNSPTTFSRMLLLSPSLAWDDGVMFKQEEAFSASGNKLAGKLFLAVGELEAAPMRDNIARFVAVLRRRHPGVILHTQTFEDETHTSVAGAAFSRGLRTLFATPAATK